MLVTAGHYVYRTHLHTFCSLEYIHFGKSLEFAGMCNFGATNFYDIDGNPIELYGWDDKVSDSVLELIRGQTFRGTPGESVGEHILEFSELYMIVPMPVVEFGPVAPIVPPIKPVINPFSNESLAIA